MTATLKKIITFAILIGGLGLTGCGGANAVTENPPEPAQNVQTAYKLKITVGDKILFATTPSFLDGITKYQNQYEDYLNLSLQ